MFYYLVASPWGQSLAYATGHEVTQLLRVLLADVASPEDLHPLNSFGWTQFLVFQLALHVALAILDRVQGRTVTRPVNDLEWFVWQVVPNPLGDMTESSALQKVSDAMDGHEGDEMGGHNLLVPFSTHGIFLGEEVEAKLPSSSRETPPTMTESGHYNRHRHDMAVKTVWSLCPPHPGLNRPHAAEGGLVTVIRITFSQPAADQSL